MTQNTVKPNIKLGCFECSFERIYLSILFLFIIIYLVCYLKKSLPYGLF